MYLQLPWAKAVDTDSNELSSNEVFSSKTTKAAANSIAKTEEESGDDQLTPKDQLLYFTIIAFRDISQTYVDRAANISESLLKDQQLKPNESGFIDEFRKNLTDFLVRYNKYQELEELFNLVDLYSNTTSHYFDHTKELATPDMLIIEGKLKEYGSDDLDKGFEKQFMLFVDSFYEKFDEYKSKINEAELQKEKAMMEWLDQFKPIQNVEEKILSFEKFFRFYEE